MKDVSYSVYEHFFELIDTWKTEKYLLPVLSFGSRVKGLESWELTILLLMADTYV